MRVAGLALAALLILPREGDAQDAPLSPFQSQKARALIRTQLPCLGCHTLDGEGSPTAPGLTGVGARRSAAYIRAIVEDPQRVVPGAAMPRTPMPDATRDLIIRYLANGATPGAPPPAPGPRAIDREPRALYQRWCAQCHGLNGGGDGPNARSLPVRPAVHNDPKRMAGRSDDALYDVIAAGGAANGASARMPAFNLTLTPVEIRSLVSVIREMCACSGPAWSRPPAR
jgi:mono/diheme cytochrome c family protein